MLTSINVNSCLDLPVTAGANSRLKGVFVMRYSLNGSTFSFLSQHDCANMTTFHGGCKIYSLDIFQSKLAWGP